ncbi:Smr/MutS family protein [Devosia nitrariae]|uniref:DNA mismatch repair protein MutS n=1 Tax=Devosia nitrariae TaxID=2071872 RepID=A0ABQ5W3Z8_9HYPH|nr:Smr/MutS family protein [Devosia nitrariae]GLQ54551.1 DNA mismatch repair protein MutS [Devosia nitrariae]
MARRDPKSPVPDFHLWTAVAETVDPLRKRRTLRPPADPLPLPEPAAAADIAQLKRAKVKHPTPIAMPAYQAPPSRPVPETAIEPRLRRKLRRGHVEIDATIDLHGMHQDEARAALNRFIPARAARGDRTVLVITGKGLKKTDAFATIIVERGVLRSMLPVWLSEPHLAPLVSGWNTAAQAHGGEGAFYVRLRQSR